MDMVRLRGEWKTRRYRMSPHHKLIRSDSAAASEEHLSFSVITTLTTHTKIRSLMLFYTRAFSLHSQQNKNPTCSK